MVVCENQTYVWRKRRSQGGRTAGRHKYEWCIVQERNKPRKHFITIKQTEHAIKDMEAEEILEWSLFE